MHFDQAAAIFNQFPLKFVNCVNSIGNGLYIKDESVVIKPKMVLVVSVESISSRLLLPMSTLLPALETGDSDCWDWWRLDRSGCLRTHSLWCQHGSSWNNPAKEGVAAFERITAELQAIMAEKGYETIEDFRGKLQHLDD